MGCVLCASLVIWYAFCVCCMCFVLCVLCRVNVFCILPEYGLLHMHVCVRTLRRGDRWTSFDPVTFPLPSSRSLPPRLNYSPPPIQIFIDLLTNIFLLKALGWCMPGISEVGRSCSLAERSSFSLISCSTLSIFVTNLYRFFYGDHFFFPTTPRFKPPKTKIIGGQSIFFFSHFTFQLLDMCQAVVTGVFPSSPLFFPSIFLAHG